MDVKELVRRRNAGETWTALAKDFPGAYYAYWKEVGFEKRAQTPAAKAAKKAWAKRKRDRAYRAKKRTAKK